MNAAIYIYYTPSWQPLADIVLPMVKQYCLKYGYRRCLMPSAENSNWAARKILYLEMLLVNYDFIWVLDLDTLITNPSIPFTDFTDDEHDIFITKDINGINAGSWIVRNTKASRDFIGKIVDNFDAPHEQILMNKYLHMVKVKYLPHPSINSYKYELYYNLPELLAACGYIPIKHEHGQWESGDLLLHLPGLSLEKRIEIFKGMI